MAQKVQTLFIDDLDGSEAEGTVRFGLDGADYEIDLNCKNSQALRDVLGPYAEAGRRTSNGARTRRAAAVRGTRPVPAAARVDATAQREYLALLGHNVKARGRIPANLAAIHVPPRDQWPSAPAAAEPEADILAAEAAELAAQHADEPPGSIEDAEPPSAAEVAAKAAADILPEPAAKPAKSASGYSAEFRAKAVAAARAEGATRVGTAKELGISEGSLRNWINAAEKAEATAATPAK